MHHAPQTQFGRPMAVAPSPNRNTAEAPDDTSSDIIDKWDVLKSLSDAAKDFGVTHRTLSVLKALMTFLPSRLINPQHRSAIVFPSNKTLSERLNRMPDSTLRRHLAALVSAGIVSRHDSANRKRFARNAGQGTRIAFGFDLSPLARRNQEIVTLATARTQQQEALQALRATVAHLRQQLLNVDGESTLTDEANKILRRQPNRTDLARVVSILSDQLATRETSKMITTDAQNERHIEDEFIDYSVPKNIVVKSEQSIQMANKAIPADGLPLKKVLRNLTAFTDYFPDPIRHWYDLISVAERMTQMMGIDAAVFKEAIAEMGSRQAAIVVLSILERFKDIENPGGYLRRLNQSARAGQFRLETILD
jgi:replication initiation protein RepC